MRQPADNWLINPDPDAYAVGFSDVLNEEALALDHSLFHYTTEAGLDGILRTGELWGTSIAYMDDPGEVRLSWDLSTEIASRWSGRSWDFDKIVRTIPKWFKGDLERERFIISFCSQPDYLLAWRAYAADSTGYCLEFTPSQLKTGDGWYLAKVEYSEEEHRNEIRRLLTRLEHAYMSVERTMHAQFLWQQTAITVAMWMSLVAPTFKEAQYESEREWRLIRMQFGDDGGQLPLKVAFRLRGGEAIPYVARAIGEGPAPALTLARILCGARLPDSTVDDVRRVALQRFPGCEVVKSQIAFRRRGPQNQH